MFRLLVHILFGATLSLSIISLSVVTYSQETSKQYVREQRTVIVRGKKEVWQLVWNGKPSTFCGPDEVYMAITCPCSGFAYGEYGQLFLVRKRGDHEIERMDLRPLFDKADYPAADKLKGTAYLRRWPMKDDDFDREDREEPNLVSEIKHRPASAIMQLADYDHDGSATEFLLQVGTLPCGKWQFAAIGVSTKKPTLHFLTTVIKSNEPLIMPLHAWQALLKGNGPSTVSTLSCGDHGSSVRTELVLSASKGDIHVKERDFSCASDGLAEKLIEETDW